MDALSHWLKLWVRRVDTQVSIFMIAIVLISSLLVYEVAYFFTYNNMIENLRTRVLAIHTYLENELDVETFYSLNTREDMRKPIYKDIKKEMEKLRHVTGVMYLYTAKEMPDGEFVYIIDGLEEKDDFRYPGDKIEPEIYCDMRRAMEGTIVWPKAIKETEWGKIFISYFPFHNEKGDIIGVLGIEIAADLQYDTYHMLRIVIPFLILVFCLLSVACAVTFFRRISNPMYQDMLNTDQLTGLKNRNSFEIDFRNLVSRQDNLEAGILVMDLDNLKQVNDVLGHEVGDLYICKAAQALQAALNKKHAAYRVGGDEFAVIFPATSTLELKEYTVLVHAKFAEIRHILQVPTSLSIGTAIFDEETDPDLRETYRRADAKMYEWKRQHRIPYRQDF